METKELINSLKSLLPLVKDKLDRSMEMAKLRNENFNVFSVLRKEHDEEHLHSAFISELLNPKGSHDQGEIFLKAFLDELKYQEFTTSSNVEVHIEKSFEEGRLDILMIDEGRKILIIENKIWAGDQLGQLARYQNYIKKNGGNGHIIYLTLYGSEASEASLNYSSTKVTKEGYSCISYQTHIVKWLERCFQLAADHPPLRETIKQYLHLVKKLTGQLTNTKMEKEIEEIFIQYSDTAWFIQNNITRWHNSLVEKFILAINEGVLNKMKNSGWESSTKLNTPKYPTITFKNNSWEPKIFLCLQGQLHFNDGNTIYGL